MKKKLSKSIISFICILVLSSSMIFCFAETVSTTEFGDFTYYCNPSGTGIGGSTTITKTSSSIYLETRGSLVYYNTGNEIYDDYDGAYNIKKAYIILWRSTETGTLKGFFTHEARGTSSIARYTSGLLYE